LSIELILFLDYLALRIHILGTYFRFEIGTFL
jgi:hypothetical protein